MNQEQESPPLTRKIRVAEIKENVDQTIVLTEAENAEIKGLLELIELDDLSFGPVALRLRRQGASLRPPQGTYRPDLRRHP